MDAAIKGLPQHDQDNMKRVFAGLPVQTHEERAEQSALALKNQLAEIENQKAEIERLTKDDVPTSKQTVYNFLKNQIHHPHLTQHYISKLFQFL